MQPQDKAPRRVLHIRSSAGFFGAERVITTLLAELPSHGIEPSLAVFENHVNGEKALLEQACQRGYAVCELPCRSRISRDALRSLKRLARDQQIECIHTHDYKSHAYGLLAARSLGIPAVATLHGWISNDVRRRFYRGVERALLPWFDSVTVVADDMAEQLRAMRFWRPPPCLTIGNAVDTGLFCERTPGLGRAHWGLAEEDFLFGVVGRLSEEKGHALLIDALARIAPERPRLKLLLVGDGPDREALAARVSRHGLDDRVVFAGTQQAVERVLQDLDCYVSPSLTEGMPMVILEAMASGIPIIATAVGAIPEMLDDGVGVLVPPRSVAALAEAMAAAADRKLDLDTLSARARRRCLDQYSVQAQAGRYSQIYQSLCA